MSLRAEQSGAKQSHTLQAVMRLLPRQLGVNCRSSLTPRNDNFLLQFNPYKYSDTRLNLNSFKKQLAAFRVIKFLIFPLHFLQRCRRIMILTAVYPGQS